MQQFREVRDLDGILALLNLIVHQKVLDVGQFDRLAHVAGLSKLVVILHPILIFLLLRRPILHLRLVLAHIILKILKILIAIWLILILQIWQVVRIQH